MKAIISNNIDRTGTNTLAHVMQRWRALCWIALALVCAPAHAAEEPYEPTFGQAGKDVVWVPTQPAIVEKMLDIAVVTPQDYVIDLGSGDGRNVIAAARRGARALGVEYDQNLVELSKRSAAAEGVADKAVFVQGDMYEADISQASVLALYLLPEIMRKLTPKFLNLKPGTRIVSNTFRIEGWRADGTDRGPGDCTDFCTVMLYIVPARVAGTWRLPQGELVLEQNFQMLSGLLKSGDASVAIAGGRLRGDQIEFTAGGVAYQGRINGDTMAGDTWNATRLRP